LIASAVLFQSLSRLLIIASYEINKDYISKNLCENKNKPKMHCNGKCHLNKQLSKQEKKDNSTLPQLKNKSGNQLCSERKLFSFKSFPLKKAMENHLYLITDYNSHFLSIYHPPEFS
jgi:hypothetical protein